MHGPWIAAVLIALCAGILDGRYRRIPNWLTISGLVVGIALNTGFFGLPGLKNGLLGALVGLAVLFPFVILRSLGAGDWKLAGALGACLGPHQLVTVLMGTVLIAGVMALAVVIWKGRLIQTLRNIARMLASFVSLHMPGPEVSLDSPESTKIPFGVAMALAVLLLVAGQAVGKF
jgi:prepilin peptidase CpaA